MSSALVPVTHNRALFLGSTEEIEVAIERGEVTFPMFMKLLYRNLRPEPPELHERLSSLYFRALPLFMANCGGIAESFYADEFVAGVVITQKDELYSNIWWDEFNFNTIPARSLESDFNDLRIKARLYLSEDHCRMCMARLFRLYKTLITSLHLEFIRWHGRGSTEHGPVCSRELTADLDQLRREFDSVFETYGRSALERAQLFYVGSAALGAMLVVIGAGIAAVLAGLANPGIWPGVIAGGALGAMLSVLERLNRGSLSIQFESGRFTLALSGFTRPLVGSLSGMALYLLVKGSVVLPLIKAGTEADQGYFFAAVAFLAGFIERLLKDVLGNPASSVGQEPQEPPRSLEPAKRSSASERRTPAD